MSNEDNGDEELAAALALSLQLGETAAASEGEDKDGKAKNSPRVESNGDSHVASLVRELEDMVCAVRV